MLLPRLYFTSRRAVLRRGTTGGPVEAGCACSTCRQPNAKPSLAGLLWPSQVATHPVPPRSGWVEQLHRPEAVGPGTPRRATILTGISARRKLGRRRPRLDGKKLVQALHDERKVCWENRGLSAEAQCSASRSAQWLAHYEEALVLLASTVRGYLQSHYPVMLSRESGISVDLHVLPGGHPGPLIVGGWANSQGQGI